ncbi:YrzI family small protein [Lysinibacillus sp. A4]|nr:MULTISPECIES: YrzI family small protein [unclassified Lysinibacillus]MCS5501168.1 YrzI family small protein [Lysinibacillus sp. A4]UKJ43353.1 YrzI family small protein [Lysinibacillus sp. ACHW1.5]WGT39431.1 YrzI family small protein [Lysinibacillus sp. 1 U-2021]
MILNFFALTITITKRKVSLEKALHDEYVKKIFEENRKKIDDYLRIRQY